MLKKLLFIFICIFFCPLSGSAEMPKHKVIIDTDCDMDDMMAILYLLKSKDVEVLAVTTTGTGMVHWKYSAPNMLKLVQLGGQPNVPVSYGAKKPISYFSSFPDDWRDPIDKIYNIPMPDNPNKPCSLNSWELITQKLKNSNDKVTILCLAPMTNVALALQKDPSLVKHIESIVISGGAINAPGNIAGKPKGYVNKCAEYNIFLDAKAAEIVFKSKAKITLAPLDATEMVPMNRSTYQLFSRNKKTSAADFVVEVMSPFVNSQNDVPVFFWDPVTAMLITDPSIGTYDTLDLTVNLEKGPEYGCLEKNKLGCPIHVCTSINSKKFYDKFHKTLNSL